MNKPQNLDLRPHPRDHKTGQYITREASDKRVRELYRRLTRP